MTPATPQSRTVVHEDSTVHVRSSGAGRHTFVLIHGIGVSRRYFRPLADALSRHARVHSVDLPGHGRSPKPRRGPSIEDHADAVWATLDRLGVERPILVGHSMGSQVAVEMGRRDRKVGGVVVLAPTNVPGERKVWRQALRLGLDTLRETPRVNAIIFSDYLLRCGPLWYARSVPAMLENHIEEGIRDVEAPVLIVRGEHDPIVPRRWVEDLASRRPGTVVAEVPGEAHVMMFHSAERVADLCLELTARA